MSKGRNSARLANVMVVGSAPTDSMGATVVGVLPDGSVNIDFLGEIHYGISTLASYRNRAKGDIVSVRFQDSQMMVVGRVGGEDAGGVELSYGVGAPSQPGFKQATAIWVAAGKIYAQVTDPGGLPPIQDQTPDQSTPTSRPDVQPTVVQAYRNGRRDDENLGKPTQGYAVGDPMGAWRGGWFFDTTLVTEMNAKAVRSAKLRLERDPDPHGLSSVVAQVYLHNNLSPAQGQLELVAGPWRGVALTLGESAWWDIPRAAIDMIRADTGKGFAIFSESTDDYLIATRGCGQVRIYN